MYSTAVVAEVGRCTFIRPLLFPKSAETLEGWAVCCPASPRLNAIFRWARWVRCSRWARWAQWARWARWVRWPGGLALDGFCLNSGLNLEWMEPGG